jgi:hypothetical protein
MTLNVKNAGLRPSLGLYESPTPTRSIIDIGAMALNAIIKPSKKPTILTKAYASQREIIFDKN